MKRLGLSRLRPVTGVLAVTAVLAGSGAAAAECARPQELHALNTRVLQTELMVAALACGYQAGYNRFVGAFRHDLVEHGGTLRAYFRRQYGSEGQTRLDHFITRLANEESGRSNLDRLAFCAATAVQLERLSGAEQVRLDHVIDGLALATRHGIPACAGAQALREE